MPFNTDLTSFKSFVGTWMDVTLASGIVDTAITAAEKRIQRGDGSPTEPGLRVREMETAFAWTITGSGTVSLPSDYLDLKHAYINTSPVQKLERKSPDFIYQAYPTRSSAGKPKFIAREASTFIFGPYPDDQYVVKGVYYKTIPSMVSDATTNGVFTAYPDLYLKATVLEAEKALGRESRTPAWEPDFKRQLQAANNSAQQEEFSGGSLRVTAS